MARIVDLTDFDRYRIEKARTDLAAKQVDMDDRAMARRVGRLEVAVQQLLDVFDGAERGERS